MLASAMMLDHVGRVDLGDRLRTAIDLTLNQDGVKTGDLGGSATTQEFAAAVRKRILAAS
jgi:isocitrate dehydrogenase (NAD+)